MNSTVIIYYGVFLAAIYFFFIRPKQKQDKKIKAMLAELKAGDEIVTRGGIIGTIVNVFDDEVVVQTSEGAALRFKKWAVGVVVEKK